MSRCELPLQKGRPMLPVWKQKNSTLSSLLPLSFISFNTSTINTCRHPSCFSFDSSPPFSKLALCGLIEESSLLRHFPIRGALVHMRDSSIAAGWDWWGRMSRAGNAANLYLKSMNLDTGLGFWLAGKCLYTDRPG